MNIHEYQAKEILNSFGIPVPPSTMGVSDEVKFEIETEFTGPAWKDPGTPTPPAQ